MFKFDISKVTFEESYTYILMNSERLYFVAPAEWVADTYPEADGSTIMVEFRNADDILLGKTSYVGISPTKITDGDMVDYDWNDILLEHDEVMQLVDKAAVYLQEHRGTIPNWSNKYMDWKAKEKEASNLEKDVKVLMVALVGGDTMCVAAYSQLNGRTKIINVFKGKEATDIFNTLTSVEHYKEEK